MQDRTVDNIISVYRTEGDSEVARLQRHIAELEAAFDGLLPCLANRGHCPFCGSRGLVYNTIVPARKKGWFRAARAQHVKRKHAVCGAVWRERL